MSHQITRTCDGCDAKFTGKQRHKDWTDASVHTTGLKDGVGDERLHYDLCYACQRHLREIINPKRWPRREKATAA